MPLAYYAWAEAVTSQCSEGLDELKRCRYPPSLSQAEVGSEAAVMMSLSLPKIELCILRTNSFQDGLTELVIQVMQRVGTGVPTLQGPFLSLWLDPDGRRLLYVARSSGRGYGTTCLAQGS